MSELLASLGRDHWCDRGAIVEAFIARNLSPADLRHELLLAIEDYTLAAQKSLSALLSLQTLQKILEFLDDRE